MHNSDILPGKFSDHSVDSVRATLPVSELVDSQVMALLMTSPAYLELSEAQRQEIRKDMAKISSYTAALVHEDWSQTQKLGQTPVVKISRVTEVGASELQDASGSQPTPQYAESLRKPRASEFDTRAADSVARITESTLNAIAFPTFVADLIKGTFNAIVDASIQQMEAFGELLSNVAKTVDQFMADNISDNSAIDWIAGAFPRNYTVNTSEEQPNLEQNEDLSEDEEDRMRRTLKLPEGSDLSDVEAVIIPAARRNLAQSRQQMLSSMVLMGINRIVVTRGRIKAQMGFRIDTRDAATASAASKFDMKTEAQAKYGNFLSPVSASVKTSVAYVSSSQKDSENEIDVSANLTGEVDLQFKSDVFPLERFADAGVISSIQGNTANPSASSVVTSNSS